jgi:hypothetical protein
VVGAARSVQALDALVAEITAGGHEAAAFPTDMPIPHRVRALVANAEGAVLAGRHMGQLCRGQRVWGRVEDITDEEFDRILHVDPAGLIIGPHVRVHPRLDKEFLASIKTDDVEEVDTVYRDRSGPRRPYGASGAPPALSRAGTPTGTVPVRVLSQPADADHIITQLSRTSSPHCASSRRAPSGVVLPATRNTASVAWTMPALGD